MNSWIRKMGKAAAMGLGMILILACAFGAFAEEGGEEPASVEIFETVVSMTPEAKISDTEAASGYISQIMKGAFGQSGETGMKAATRGGVARSQLDGKEAAVYDALKPLIEEVAAGQRTSTIFTIPRAMVYGDDEKIQYTAEELGVSAIVDSNNQLTDEAWDAFDARIGINNSLVIDALLADLPYDLYWYNKTSPTYLPGVSYNSLYISVPANLTYQFPVSVNYAPSGSTNGYTVDTTYGASAVTAAENARQVVESNKYKPDYQKLYAYKNYICAAVDYNDDAAANSETTPYGDPWQLIWVFDGDDSTKVVCEGYSKAFQFLCDESTFDNTSVISVSGTMQGGTGAGNHMWNIVTMGEGIHYLADITNSDAGTVGAGGELFIKGYTVKVPDADYAYTYLAQGNTYVIYTYDAGTIAMLESTGRLAMIGEAERPTVAVSAHGNAGQDVTLSFTNPSGSDVDLYWEIFYAMDEDTAESVLWDDTLSLMAGGTGEQLVSGLNFPKAGDYQVLLYIDPGEEGIDYETLELVSAADFTLTEQALPVISVDCPSQIEDGESLTFTVISEDGTVEAIAVQSCGWDSDLNEPTWGYGLPLDPSEEGNTGMIPYEEPGLMKAWIWGKVNDVWSESVEITAGVRGVLTPATISGPETIQLGENAVFEIQADSRASGYSWYVEDSDRNQIAEGAADGLSEEDTLTIKVPADSFTGGGEYSIVFVQEGSEYLAGKETIFEFKVKKVLSLNYEVPESARAGEPVTIHWTPTVEGQYLYLYVVNEEGLPKKVGEMSYEGDYNITGYYLLNAGECTIVLETYAEGWEMGEAVVTIPVTENPDQPAAPTISLDTENPTIKTSLFQINLGALYNACDCTLYSQDFDGNWVYYNREFNYGSSYYYYWGKLSVGTWKVSISVANNTVWSKPAELVFNVTEAPTLAQPVLAEEEIGEIRLNSRFSIMIEAVENATSYSARLIRYADDGSGATEEIVSVYKYDGIDASEIMLTFIDWNEGAAAGTCRIEVTASADGYESATLVIDPVQVVAMDAPAAPTAVQICKSDGTARTAEELANIYTTYDASLYARISYNQPFQMYEYRILEYNSSYESWRVGSSEYSELDTPANTVLCTFGDRYYKGNYKLQVRVMVDDLWSEWSDEIAYSIVDPPTLKSPTVTPEKTNLTMGESLRLTITDIDSHANYITILMNSNSLDDYYDDALYELMEPMEVVIPEEAFLEGENMIEVFVKGREDDASMSGSTSLTVTVTGGRSEAPTVTWDATSGAYGEFLMAEVEAAGASEVMARILKLFPWDSETEDKYYPLSSEKVRVPFEITFYDYINVSVQFRGLINGVWSEWSDKVTIESTTSLPSYDSSLQDFVVCPEEIIPGEDLTLTLLPVEGITRYQIDLSKAANEYINVFSEIYDEPGEITIPARCFSAGGEYYFDFTAFLEGDSDTRVWDSMYFTISEDAEGLAPLNISAEKETLAYLERVEISLGGTEAEEISWMVYRRTIRETEYQLYDIGQTAATAVSGPLTGFTFYDMGVYDSGAQYRIQAKAKVNGEWTAWSNELELTMLPRKNIRLANPVPRVTAQVTAGEPAYVTWEAVDLAEQYTVSWSGNGKSGRLTTQDCFADIPTEGMAPGTYTVCVQAAATGYADDGHVYTVAFEITQGSAVITNVLNLPANLTTIESQAFADLESVDGVRIPASVISIAQDAFSGSDITIIAPEGSYAAQWAEDHSYPLITE